MPDCTSFQSQHLYSELKFEAWMMSREQSDESDAQNMFCCSMFDIRQAGIL